MAQGRRFRFATGLLVAAGVLGSLVLLPVASSGAATSGDISAAEAGTIQQRDVPSDFSETTAMKSQAGAPPTQPDSGNDLSQEVKGITDCKGVSRHDLLRSLLHK